MYAGAWEAEANEFWSPSQPDPPPMGQHFSPIPPSLLAGHSPGSGTRGTQGLWDSSPARLNLQCPPYRQLGFGTETWRFWLLFEAGLKEQ